MASMIDDKVIWMFKISFENVWMTKLIQRRLNNNYANDWKMIINNLIWIEKDTMNYHMYGIDFG
jgi:hypothetical protein